MQVHQYDVVIVGAGGAGMRAAINRASVPGPAVLTSSTDPFAHRCRPGRHVRRTGERGRGRTREWHASSTVKGGDYLVDQDAAEVMAKEAIDAVLDLEKMGCPSTGPQKARWTSVASAVTPVTTASPPVRRSCYAAGSAPATHDPPDSVPELVKHGVEFYNEFYVLDLAMTSASRITIRLASSPTNWLRRDPPVPGQVGRLRNRRRGQGLEHHLERPHPHR